MSEPKTEVVVVGQVDLNSLCAGQVHLVINGHMTTADQWWLRIFRLVSAIDRARAVSCSVFDSMRQDINTQGQSRSLTEHDGSIRKHQIKDISGEKGFT